MRISRANWSAGFTHAGTMWCIHVIHRTAIVLEIVILIDDPIEEERIVITKDTDFVNSFVLRGQPHKLLLIATGNITNDDLMHLFTMYITDIEIAFTTNDYIEISRIAFIIHI